MANIKCCLEKCELPLDKNYWDAQYKSNNTGWDLGIVSPPIKNYFDIVANKSSAILIPGCGNTYEAEYLLEKGFTNFTVIDIAPTLVARLQEKFANNSCINIILGDFFEHQGKYNYIVEQAFFCALPPTLRKNYVDKMHQLLHNNGLLVGLLFNRDFDTSPPFGGSVEEYKQLFKDRFNLKQFNVCKTSVLPRANTELFIELKKI